MNLQKLIQQKDEQRQDDNFISFTNAELLSITDDQITHLIEYFHGYTLMRLPESEIEFFEWLKQEDAEVWQDLWGEEDDLYLISVDLLRHLAGKFGTFPICDLEDTPNYWFSEKHIKPKGSEALPDIFLKVESGQKLKINERFLFQLSGQTMDIWHFCYQFKIPLNKMKKIVDDMVYEGWIVHLPDPADLVKYIEF